MQLLELNDLNDDTTEIIETEAFSIFVTADSASTLLTGLPIPPYSNDLLTEYTQILITMIHKYRLLAALITIALEETISIRLERRANYSQQETP